MREAIHVWHPVQLSVSWLEAGGEQMQTKTLTAAINVADIVPMALGTDEALELGNSFFSVRPGETFTFAIPIVYMQTHREKNTDTGETTQVVDASWTTNMMDGHLVPYEAATTPADAYDQEIAGVLSVLQVGIAAGQGASVPPGFLEGMSVGPHDLLAGGVNQGFAVFGAYTMPLDAVVGTAYPVNLTVTVKAKIKTQQTSTFTAYIEVADPAEPMLWGKNGVIVFTHSQLRSMLMTTQYDPIYLGDCRTDMPANSWEVKNDGIIQYPTSDTSGIPVTRSVTIVGTDPRNNRRIQVIDKASSSFNRGPTTDGIYLNTSGITVTVRNVNWEGYNSSGIACSRVANTSVEYININYTGCRAYCSTSANTKVSFSGCNVLIQDMGDNNRRRGQEALRAGEVVLKGTNTFERSNASGSNYDHAVFWMDLAPHTVTVSPGADVTVNTTNYFMMDSGSRILLNIQGKLSVHTTGNNGCMTYGTNTISNCTISRGGELVIRHESSSYGSLRVDKLTVEGSLDMLKPSGSGFPCIALASGNSVANFNSPKRVSLQNLSSTSGAQLIRSFAGSPIVNFYGISALNRWAGNGTKSIWNNQGLDRETFDVNFKVGISTGLSSFSTNLKDSRGVALTSAGSVTSALTATNLGLNGDRRVVFGQYDLTTDDVYTGATLITGDAPDSSSQTISERSGSGFTWSTVRQSVTADTAGRHYRADLPQSVADATRVYVQSTKDDFEAHTYADRGTVCRLFSVPETLDFGTVAVPGYPQLVDRQETDWTIQVLDTRDTGNWILSASADPLTSEDGLDTLPNALVFVKPDGTWQPLSSVTVAEKQSDATPGITDLVWAQDEGLHIYLNSNEGTAGQSYTTTITWTLEIT